MKPTTSSNWLSMIYGRVSSAQPDSAWKKGEAKVGYVSPPQLHDKWYNQLRFCAESLDVTLPSFNVRGRLIGSPREKKHISPYTRKRESSKQYKSSRSISATLIHTYESMMQVEHRGSCTNQAFPAHVKTFFFLLRSKAPAASSTPKIPLIAQFHLRHLQTHFGVVQSGEREKYFNRSSRKRNN